MRRMLVFAVAAGICAGASVAGEPGSVAFSGAILVEADQGLDGGAGPGRLFISEVTVLAENEISEAVTARVGVIAEDDLDAVGIDEACFTLEPFKGASVEFIAGYTALPFGLLNTHLVSDPVVLDAVETVAPSLQAAYAPGPFTVSAGFFKNGTDDGGAVKAAIAAVPSTNLEASVRVLSDGSADVDAAAEIGLLNGAFVIDAEIFAGAVRPAGEPVPLGFFCGAAFAVVESFEFELRIDGIRTDTGADMGMRYAGGGTYSLANGVFTAFEAAYDADAEENTAAVQVGVEF